MMLPRETLAEEWDEAQMPAYNPARYGSVAAGGIDPARVVAIADAADGGGTSDRADGLSRAQCGSRRRAGALWRCLRHQGRGVQLDRSQRFAGFAVLCRFRSDAAAGTGRCRPAARYRRALRAAIRQARRSDRLDPDRHRSAEVGFPDVGFSDRHEGAGRLRDCAAAGARGGRRRAPTTPIASASSTRIAGWGGARDAASKRRAAAAANKGASARSARPICSRP